MIAQSIGGGGFAADPSQVLAYSRVRLTLQNNGDGGDASIFVGTTFGGSTGGALGYEIDNCSANNSLVSAHGNALLEVRRAQRELGPWILTGAMDAGIGRLNSARTIPIADAVG